LDKIAETPQIGIRASANMWKKPMTSVPADGEANLRAGRPTVRDVGAINHCRTQDANQRQRLC